MKRILLACALAAALAGAAAAQSLVGNASLGVTTSSARVALPAGSVNSPYVMVRPITTTPEVFYALGDVTVTALATGSALPPNGICLNVGPSAYLAAITSTSTNTLRVTRLTLCPNF